MRCGVSKKGKEAILSFSSLLGWGFYADISWLVVLKEHEGGGGAEKQGGSKNLQGFKERFKENVGWKPRHKGMEGGGGYMMILCENWNELKSNHGKYIHPSSVPCVCLLLSLTTIWA